MIRHLPLTLAAIAASVGSPAFAQVLYSDDFSRVTGSGDGNGDPNGPADNFSDWGTNNNALGGTNAQAWEAGPSRAGGGRNSVTDGDLAILHGTTGFYDYDVTTVAPNGFQVALDFSRFVVTPDPGPGAGGYIAFGLGVDSGTALGDFTAIGAADWAILFQQANSGNAANAEAFSDNVLQGNFDYFQPDTPHTLLLTVTPDTPGAYGETDSINIDVLIDGALSQSFTTTGGANFGSFAASANNFDTRFIDNLVVSAIPEPGSALLLGAAIAGSLVRRRH